MMILNRFDETNKNKLFVVEKEIIIKNSLRAETFIGFQSSNHI